MGKRRKGYISERQYLTDYFQNTWWRHRMPKFGYSSYGRVLSQLKEDDKVLDVGCGVNPMKYFHHNTYGIDIADRGADEVVAIENFKSEERFDVAICWGSINFGYWDLIQKQVENLVEHMKWDSVIYWRLNPGLADHNNEDCKAINFFNWNTDLQFELANKYLYSITEIMPERNRIYVKWERGDRNET